MLITLTCPHCGGKLQEHAENAGKLTGCPHCAKAVPVLAPLRPAVIRDQPPATYSEYLLRSIRTACWTIAGILIALLVLTVLALLFGALLRPDPHF
jgi:hypothetical protein